MSEPQFQDFQQRREQQEFVRKSVQVSFSTIADLQDMTDEDLIDLGKFVVQIAADARKREEEGLV